MTLLSILLDVVLAVFPGVAIFWFVWMLTSAKEKKADDEQWW